MVLVYKINHFSKFVYDIGVGEKLSAPIFTPPFAIPIKHPLSQRRTKMKKAEPLIYSFKAQVAFFKKINCF